jgi:hypothetical protein
MRIRKQVDELTLDDLERYPIWEYLPDEEQEFGQDEATVKPRPDLSAADPDMELALLARTDFTASDGTSFTGYCQPRKELIDTRLVICAHPLSSIQPVIIVDDGHVMFWYGIVEPTRERLDESYTKLQRNRVTPFPIHFHSPFVVNGTNSGTIPAFLCLSQVSEKRKGLMAKLFALTQNKYVVKEVF